MADRPAATAADSIAGADTHAAVVATTAAEAEDFTVAVVVASTVAAVADFMVVAEGERTAAVADGGDSAVTAGLPTQQRSARRA